MTFAARTAVVVSVNVLLGCSPQASSAEDAGAADAQLDVQPDVGVCDRTLPDCPATPPSYAGNVAAIVHERCAACHYTGSTIAKIDLSSYGGVSANRGSVLNQVYACTMPPDGGTPLTSAERTTLMTWLVCGAPNN